MADFSNIIQEINTNLPDNNTQAITAKKLRDTLIDLTDTISTEQNNYEQTTDQTIQAAISQFQPTVVVDNLNSTSPDEALSANQGRLINNILEPLSNTFVKRKNIYATTSGGEVLSGFEIKAGGVITAQNNCRVAVIIIDEQMRNTRKIDITGYKRGANASGYLYILTDADDNFLTGFQGGTGEITTVLDGNSIPQNAAKLKINYYYSSSSSYSHPYSVVLNYYEKFLYPITKIVPELERGRLSSSGQPSEFAEQGGGTGKFYPNNQRTMNYIKVVADDKIKIYNSINCVIRVYEYNSDYEYVKQTDITVTADTFTEYTPANEYIKIHWNINSSTDTSTNVPPFKYYIVGHFDTNWNVKNVYPLDSGYAHLTTTVYPIVPNSTQYDTNQIQDFPIRYYDDGLIVFPETYTNNGKPTRLIIYCHGAGVNYSQSQRRFPSTDLLPEYWLKNGYAIMDVDGECNVNSYGVQHQLVPESLQCYVDAYQSVIKKYNICTDGVFLGGRSMGGGMSMYIMNSNRIPVIANCPVVPVMNTLWLWAYLSSSAKSYMADKMGFVGDITWSSSNTLTTAEWQYLQDNFDNLRRWSPLWGCITDLPTDKTVLFNNSLRVSCTNTNVPAEIELYGSLHAKVNAPVKFFDNYADPTVPYERNALLMYKMLLNSGCITELRMFDTTNDTDTSITAHHFELRTDRLTTATLPSGEVLTNVPVVYVEMLRFWQRYELIYNL